MMFTPLVSASRLETTRGLELSAGKLQPLFGPVQIEVLEGSVWITQSGDATDHIVNAGHSWQAPRPGKVVVQAMSPARIRLA